jgi:hypothetical protein
MNNTLAMSKRELKSAVRASVRESIREVLAEELIAARAMLTPFVSDAEQRDIERRYGLPSHKVAKSVSLSL